MISWRFPSHSRLSRLVRIREENGCSEPSWMRHPPQVVAICNQKGGCAKTTTAINLAADLARRGHPSLLIDLDPQAHASLGLGLEVERLSRTIYDLFQDPARRLEELILPTRVRDLFLAPANAILSGAQLELAQVPKRETVLRRAVRELSARFQFVLIDCSPSLNLLTINALTAADHVLIPVQLHYYALEGMKDLFSTIELIQARFNARLKILGILPVLVDDRWGVSQEILEQIQDYFKDRVMQSRIALSEKILEASIAGQPVSVYAPDSMGAKDYRACAKEFLERLGLGTESASPRKNGTLIELKPAERHGAQIGSSC